MSVDATEMLTPLNAYDWGEVNEYRDYALDRFLKRWFGSDTTPAYAPDDSHWKAVDLVLDLEGWDSKTGELTVVSNAIAAFFMVLDDVAGELAENRGDRQWLRVRGPNAARMLREAHANLGGVLDAWVTKAARPPAPEGAITAGELIARLAAVPPDTPVELLEYPETDESDPSPIWPVTVVRYDEAAGGVTLGN